MKVKSHSRKHICKPGEFSETVSKAIKASNSNVAKYRREVI